MQEDQEFSYYRVRPGDLAYLIARRCQKQLQDIGDGLDRIAALERQQTEASLEQCKWLELKVEIAYLRLELKKAQRSQR